MRRRRTSNFWLGLGFRLRLGHRFCRLYRGITVFRGRLRRRLVTFHQIRGHAGLGAGDAVRKQRLAIALNLFLGAEHVCGQQLGRIELTTRRTTNEQQHDGERCPNPN